MSQNSTATKIDRRPLMVVQRSRMLFFNVGSLPNRSHSRYCQHHEFRLAEG